MTNHPTREACARCGESALAYFHNSHFNDGRKGWCDNDTCHAFVAPKPPLGVGALEAIARRFIGRESSVGYDHWLTGLREAFALGQATPRDLNPIPCGYCTDKPFDHDGAHDSETWLWCEHGYLVKPCAECCTTAAKPEPAVGVDRYSDDRLSLAQEIAETLKSRGHWVPANYAGPDLIMAVGKALDAMPPTETAKGGEAKVNEHAAFVLELGDRLVTSKPAMFSIPFKETGERLRAAAAEIEKWIDIATTNHREAVAEIDKLKSEIERLERERDECMIDECGNERLPDEAFVCTRCYAKASQRADRLAAELARAERHISVSVDQIAMERADLETQLYEAKHEIGARKGDPVTRLHNICRALGEDAPVAEQLEEAVSYATELERKLAEVTQMLSDAIGQRDNQLALHNAALAREAGLRGALEWYADKANWEEGGYESNGPVGWVTEVSDAAKDEGQRARAALSASPEGVAEAIAK